MAQCAISRRDVPWLMVLVRLELIDDVAWRDFLTTAAR